MKKLLQIPLLLVALFLTSIPISADDFEVGGIYYNILTDSTVAVTYKGSNYDSYSNEYTGAITIPSSVTYNGNTYSVTSIGVLAFRECTGLTSVTIPNSVTSIGGSAFSGCTGLTSVTIPNSVTSIGGGAFRACSGLTSVTIPNSVTTIGNYAFSDCSGLTSVTIPNSVTWIVDGAFSGCSGLTSVTIPNSVTSIGYSAFWGCTGLTSVTIPNSVTWIGGSAFYGCIGLTSIVVASGNNVYDSRDNCNAIIEKATNTLIFGCNNTTIPNSVTTIGEEAFNYCTRLTAVIIEDGIDTLNFVNSNWGTFMECPLDTLYLGRNINESPFSFNKLLKSVVIGDLVTTIGDDAFEGCSGLTSVTIPNSVTSIGDRAFYGCTGLVDCNIETTHTSATIGLSSDSNCSPYIYYYGKYYKDGDIITGLSPYTNASNWSTSSGRYLYDYGLTINGLRCCIYDDCYFYTKKIDLNIEGTEGVTYVDCSWSYLDDDATLISKKITINNSSIETEDNTIQIKNLDPNTSYRFDYDLKYKGFSDSFKFYKTFYTASLEMTTQEAKPTSTTSVRLLAATNCDATEGTGFEWRRYDAPDELPSSKVSCPVVDGVLVGSLRGVKDDVYYKYRPFYTSSSGKTYYGDWIAFFTGDANVYFEPEVRTYEDIQVINNSATVKGYALEGTDVITSQGFEYWKTGSTIKPASTDDRMTVSASGISMSATLANLEYNSTYKYRAYVTTAKGTVYGDEMEFSTGEDPSGIGYIEIDSDEFVVTLRENPATGTAWVKIAGAAGEEVQYTLTSMSGAMVANGTVLLDGEWNAIDLNCSAGMYLLTINDGTQVKTLRLIVK